MYPSPQGGIAMNANELLTVGLTAALLLTGIVAVGGATPADVPADNTHANETPADNGPEIGDNDTDDSGPADEGPTADPANDSVGPTDGVPDQAPSHVSEIHETIDSFLNGSVDHLGNALSELLGDETAVSGNESATESAENE